MAVTNLSQALRSADWAVIVKRLLSERSRERVKQVRIGYEGERSGTFLYITRRHDDETLALPIDADQLENRGTLSWGEDELALLILFLG